MKDDDPFRHHPGLRDKIIPAEQSFFRDFTTEKLRALAEQHGMPVDWWYSEDVREAHRARTLAGRMDDDLWVFGYGSLMWDPALKFSEVRRGRISGYARRFILMEVHGGRGTEDCPGPMAALDNCAACEGCEGLVFRLPRETLERETEIFWRREVIAPAYRVEFVPAETSQGMVEALILAADHEADQINADVDREKIVQLIASASGVLGTSADYLRQTVEKLEQLGIEDEETWSLWRDVQAVMAAG